MKARERLAASIIAIGVGICILVIVWIVAWFSPRRGGLPRPPFPWSAAGGTALVGVLITLTGFIITLIIYLGRRWGYQRVYTNTTVLALFCTNRAGEMIVYPMGFPPNEMRYYVHLGFSDGSSDEFECSSGLYQRLREGMRGEAVCKGNLLLAFYPYPEHAEMHGNDA